MRFLEAPIAELLPRAVRDALPVPKDFDRYIADPKKEVVSWESSEHAIYLGKWPRLGSGVESIYTDEVILALVDYALAQGPGPVRIVLCPHFSEWFNGEILGDAYLHPAEQAHYLEELLCRNLKIPRERLEIVCEVEDRAPQFLFMELARRHSLGEIVESKDVFKSFDGTQAFVNPTALSYQIAGRLFLAAEADLQFKRRFFEAIPGHDSSQDIPHDWGSAGYALVEVAMRLADLIQGRAIQLGVDRQGKYDGIIESILKDAQKTGSGRRPALVDVYPLLQGKAFRPIKLKIKENYYVKKQKQREAQVGLLTSGVRATLLLALGAGVNEWKHHHEDQAREERLADRIEECTRGIRFPICDTSVYQDSFCFMSDSYLSGEQAVPRIRDEIEMDIHERYPATASQAFGPQIVDYLCRSNPDRLRDAYAQHRVRVRLADGFVKDQAASLLSEDLSLDRPYAELWAHRNLLHLGATDRPGQHVRVGEFRDANQGYVYRFWTDAERSGVWAEQLLSDGTVVKALSLEVAHDGIRAFFALQQDFDAHEMRDYYHAHAETFAVSQNAGGAPLLCHGGDAWLCSRPDFTWKDAVDGVTYQFYGSYDGGLHMLARRNPDDDYTSQVAVEAVGKLNAIDTAVREH